jgi:ABC-2 type transport system permease protein
MKKINTILRKEWAEVFRNRLVLFTIIFLPLIMTAIPLGILYSMSGETALADASTEMPAQFGAVCPENITSAECFQVFMVNEFLIMFMILPLAIPSTIASYSIVGEKVNRSLEPLLATPISTAELLLGKSFAAAIPGIIATWIGFVIFAVGAAIIVTNQALLFAIVDARWILAIFLVGPLMAILSVNVSVIVSSRVNDPRTAEQISMVVILPVLLIFFGQIAGLFIINKQLILFSAIVLFLADILLVFLAVRLFQRETILTRWK